MPHNENEYFSISLKQPERHKRADETFSAGQLQIGDININGGYLREQDGDKFFDKLIKDSRILPMVTTVNMKSIKQNLASIAVNGMILRRRNYDPTTNSTGWQGREMKPAYRVKADPSKTTLDAFNFVAEMPIGIEVTAENIEGENLVPLLMEKFAVAMRSSVERWLLTAELGLTPLPADDVDGVLALQNGWLAGAAFTRNAANAPLSYNLISNAAKAIPTQYAAASNPNFACMVSSHDYQDYLNEAATRGNGIGVAAYQAQDRVGGLFGMPMVVDWMPGSKALIADTKDMVVGHFRDSANMRTYYDNRRYEDVLVAEFYLAGGYINDDRAVRLDNVGPAAEDNLGQ
jgi:hypothetical protein